MPRPDLNAATAPADFNSYYWLKSELVSFARSTGLATAGSKEEIAARIRTFLRTGAVTAKPVPGAPPVSAFDWAKAPLSSDTVLTDSYKSTEAVRAFTTAQIGPRFRFTVPFMKWAKASGGKTLGDAVAEWNRQAGARKNKSPEIAPQFEYNRYTRAFLADNPGKTAIDAAHYWKLKRSAPGSNAYDRSDLALRPEMNTDHSLT